MSDLRRLAPTESSAHATSVAPALRSTAALFAVCAVASMVGCGSDERDGSQTTPTDTGVTTDVADGSGTVPVDGSSAPGPDAGADTEAPLPGDLDDGEACAADEQCTSGRCLSADDGFPGGYCTFVDCESRRDCAGAGRACLRGEFNGNLCVELCEEDGDCREGYECVGQGGGAFCFPAYAGDALNPVCESEFIAADNVRAPVGNFALLDRHEVKFTIDEGTTSFMMVAWDRNDIVYPESFTAPDGTTINLFDYASYYFSPVTFGTVAPVMFPGGPAFEDFVMPGEYTVSFGYDGAQSDQICWVVMQEEDSLDPDGDDLVVDVNFYFVGVPGLNASNADNSDSFQAMLAEFDNVWRQGGIRLGDVQYYDVTGDVEDQYAVIREQDAVFNLVQLSRQPGTSRGDLLSANVFFIQGFAGEMGGVLGVSAGIPGAAGVHGSPGTGLVFSADNLRGNGGPTLVGQVLAHEFGHFIGLFHTTESQGGGTDQLDDTPECDIRNTNLQNCPDASNLMFPTALFRSFLEVSDGQILIARANPLTKPASRADESE